MLGKSLTRLSVLCLAVVLLLAGRTARSQTAFYIPKSLITPVHTHKGELHVSLGLGGGYDANVSYAFADHFAAFVTGTVNTRTAALPNLFGRTVYDINRNDYALKGGVGFFTATPSRLVHFVESYAGLGTYKVDNYVYERERPELGKDYTQARFWNVFWQVQAGRRKGRRESAVALRLAYARYPHFRFRNAYEVGEYRYENLSGVTLDPVMSQSFVLNRFKINLQAGASIQLGTGRGTEVRTRDSPAGPVVTTEAIPLIKPLKAFLCRLALQYNFDLRKAGNKN
jgi:hypothetical protein